MSSVPAKSAPGTAGPDSAAPVSAQPQDQPGPGSPQPRPTGQSAAPGSAAPESGTRPPQSLLRRMVLVPPQHGAWAFLALPIALALTVAPASILVIPLVLAWVAAYPASFAALGLIRARRGARFKPPFAFWSTITALAALSLVVFRPWLLAVGAGFAVAFSANLFYAHRNDERALLNDLVFTIECAAMVPVTWAVAAGRRGWSGAPGWGPGRLWALTTLCLLLLIASTLHVKSLIRQRRNPIYRRVSQIFAITTIPASCGLAAWYGPAAGWWLVPPSLFVAARSFIVGRKPLPPKEVGLIELAGFVLALGCAILAAAL